MSREVVIDLNNYTPPDGGKPSRYIALVGKRHLIHIPITKKQLKLISDFLDAEARSDS